MPCPGNMRLFKLLLLSQSHSWQPGIKNPYRGVVVWPVPENVEITVTLFKVRTAGLRLHPSLRLRLHLSLHLRLHLSLHHSPHLSLDSPLCR